MATQEFADANEENVDAEEYFLKHSETMALHRKLTSQVKVDQTFKVYFLPFETCSLCLCF